MTGRDQHLLLQSTSLAQLTNWSVRYLLETSFSYNKKYDLVPIGSFLKRRRDIIHVEDEVEYQQVTVKINGNGVEERGKKFGKNIGTKRQYRASAGQFIMSKIDARNGAFGIVPEELDGAMVTNDFPLFDIDEEKILSNFFVLLTSTKEFINFAQSCSSGTTNRQRIDLDLFLKQAVPIPTIQEQKQILNEYSALKKASVTSKAEAENINLEIKNILEFELGVSFSSKSKNEGFLRYVNFKNLNRWDGRETATIKSKYNVLSLGDCIKEMSTGTTPPTSNDEYFGGEINFYTPSDLTGKMYLDEAERKLTKKAVKDGKARIYKKGTVLFVGIGSTVGKVGIIQNNLASSNQQITGFVTNEEILNNEYVYHYLNVFKKISTKEKTQSTIPIINQEKIKSIPIPVPPVIIQNKISSKINEKLNAKENLFKRSDELLIKANNLFKNLIFQD